MRASTAIVLLAVLLLAGVLVATPVIWTIPPLYQLRAAPYVDAFAAAENQYGLPAGLLARVAYQESRFDASAASPAGALGLMQFMPATARQYGADPLDPFQSIDAAGRYLRDLYRQFGSWSKALAAYNWGAGNVQAYQKTGYGAHGQPMPDETKQYFAAITSDLGLA